MRLTIEEKANLRKRKKNTRKVKGFFTHPLLWIIIAITILTTIYIF
jgi:hypothetical protein